MKTPQPRRHDRSYRGLVARPGLMIALFAAGTSLGAQTTPLPETPQPACPAVVAGSVVDVAGNDIPFARVEVVARPGDKPDALRESTVGEDGAFQIPGIPGGGCVVRVAAEGFFTRVVPVTSAKMDVQLVASDTADVTVNSNQEEIAETQIHLQETQMIGGVIPNFYVAYDYHAAPLNKRQKFPACLKTLINPYTNLINAGLAGVEQADNALPGYHQGAADYARRFGAATADTAIGTVLAGAVLPIVFHQDPRYFYMGKGTVMHRLLYALATSVIARGDNGKWQPAYAAILGDFGAGAISNLYYPSSDRSSGAVTIYNGLISTGLDGFGNVIQEFVFRHFTPHVPPSNP